MGSAKFVLYFQLHVSYNNWLSCMHFSCQSTKYAEII